MRAAEHAPRDPFHVLQRLHGLAEIVERGAGVPVERLRVIVAFFAKLERVSREMPELCYFACGLFARS